MNLKKFKRNGLIFMILLTTLLINLNIYCAAKIESEREFIGSKLINAIQNKNIEKVKSLIAAGTNVNEKDSWLETPLMIASRIGAVEIAEFLLNNGAEINAVNKDNQTALLAALNRGRENMVPLLIKYGSNVNHKESDHENIVKSVLHNTDIDESSAQNIIKLLIDNGLDIELSTINNWTALMFAARNGYYEIVKLLLKEGADINNKTIRYPIIMRQSDREIGIDAHEIAKRNWHTGIVKLLEDEPRRREEEQRKYLEALKAELIDTLIQNNYPKDLAQIIVDYLNEPIEYKEFVKIRKAKALSEIISQYLPKMLGEKILDYMYKKIPNEHRAPK